MFLFGQSNSIERPEFRTVNGMNRDITSDVFQYKINSRIWAPDFVRASPECCLMLDSILNKDTFDYSPILIHQGEVNSVKPKQLILTIEDVINAIAFEGELGESLKKLCQLKYAWAISEGKTENESALEAFQVLTKFTSEIFQELMKD